MTFFLISVLKFKCYKQKNRPFFELFRLNGFPEKLLIEFHGSNFYNEESFCVNISRIKKAESKSRENLFGLRKNCTIHEH